MTKASLLHEIFSITHHGQPAPVQNHNQEVETSNNISAQWIETPGSQREENRMPVLDCAVAVAEVCLKPTHRSIPAVRLPPPAGTEAGGYQNLTAPSSQSQPRLREGKAEHTVRKQFKCVDAPTEPLEIQR